MRKKYFYSPYFLIVIVVFGCKPKTELYLERGLDILSNIKKVDFKIYPGIKINEIGVIRDQKEGIKTLVFKLDDSTNAEAFNNKNQIGIRVWIVDENKNRRKENWNFKPQLIQVKQYKYILRKINIKEDKIAKMKIYMYKEKGGKKQKIGDSLMLNKINTYND